MSAPLEQELTIERFESGQVDPGRFDHEAHVYVAWLYVTTFDPAAAILRFDNALRRLTAELGVPEKYHATITWLFLLLVAEKSREDERWERFKARNEDLFGDSKTILRRYYSESLLSSKRAKSRFLLPDRLAI
ncbi:MAG: hypothetical protein WBM34_01170 [Woeseiaceae bacterium]|jgi:hypothetical protein